MSKRVVINGQMSIVIALIFAVVCGGLAMFGAIIVYFALNEGNFDWIVIAMSIGVLGLLWVVFAVLWSALGVWMIITPEGVRTVGAFGSHRYPAQGLRVGMFRKKISTGEKSTSKTHKGEQLWVRASGKKPRLVAHGLEGDPLFNTIKQALDEVLGVPIMRLEVDTTRVITQPDFSPFDEAETQ